MSSVSIFLASSLDLIHDRKEFEIYVRRKDSYWQKKGVRLKLILCEDFLNAASYTRSQTEYNKSVEECNIFVLLFFTKVGVFSEEEFDVAFKKFKQTGAPKIFTFCKNGTANTKNITREDMQSLFNFKEKLKKLGHYSIEYENTADLNLKFGDQLDKLVEDGFITFGDQEKQVLPKELTINIPKIHANDIVGRENDIQEIRKLLCEENRIVVVNGIGGIGKTTIAQLYISKYYHQYNHVVWITQTSENIITDFINAPGLRQNLGLTTYNTDSEILFEEIMRKMKNIPSSNCLLVVDNADNFILKYQNLLPSQPQWHLLITSREKIPGYYIKALDFLDERQSIQLFKKYYNIKIANDDEIKELVRYLDYHTLIIKLLAITAETQRYEVRYLRQVLQSDLKANVVIEHNFKQHKIFKISSFLSTVFNMGQLSEIEVWLLQNIACLHSQFYSYNELKALIVDPKSIYNDFFSETITGLTKKGWLFFNPAIDSYKMHLIVSEVVLQQVNLNHKNFNYVINSLTGGNGDNPIIKYFDLFYKSNHSEQFEAKLLKAAHQFNHKIQLQKRVFDVVFSFLVLFFILSWLVPVVALLIKLDSKGPVFFVQARAGKDNSVFLWFKFRCIRIDENTSHLQVADRNMLVTKIGSFLLKTGLDSFPQLINVLKGEMSIVGPRPLMLKHTEKYLELTGQSQVTRFFKPGITGWAQVNGLKGNRMSMETVQQTVEHDLWYIRHWSLYLELKIMILSLIQTIKGEKM